MYIHVHNTAMLSSHDLEWKLHSLPATVPPTHDHTACREMNIIGRSYCSHVYVLLQSGCMYKTRMRTSSSVLCSGSPSLHVA